MFRKLDVKKMRVGEATLANPANPANRDAEGGTVDVEISKISGISKPLPSNSYFLDSASGDASDAETDASHREGPPYPDGSGMVKCFYCSNIEITGRRAVCSMSLQTKNGIALLIECSDFVKRTVH